MVARSSVPDRDAAAGRETARPTGDGRAVVRDDWPAAPVIYEVYPRSFLDTTGSGEGDLRGIARGLDHIADLGADAVWIAPFFVSPMADGGYDISDHTAVDPCYGTLEDFDALVEKAHGLGLKVMVDCVFNHTSVKHAWFEKSRRREDGFDDWFVWADPQPGGGLPNNWISYFGPPAWTWCAIRRQYYLHQFLSCQPSLNLRNEAVHAELESILGFWCARGVDGFRFDAVTSFIHNPDLTDNPPARSEVQARMAGPDFLPYALQDHVHDMLPGDGADFGCLLREWAGGEKWLLGENNSGNQSIEIAQKFTGAPGLDALYTIDLPERGVSAEVIADVLSRLGGPGPVAWWLSSHDQPRHATRDGNGSARDARFLALVAAALPGPWLIYQGEELGLPQPDLAPDEMTDIFDRMYADRPIGRSGARVAIPWAEEGPAFGFTSGTPWLPMRWQQGSSVAAQAGDEGSVLSFYRRLVRLRRKAGIDTATWQDVVVDGETLDLTLSARSGARMAVRMNFGQDAASLPGVAAGADLLVASDRIENDLPARTGAIWTLP